MALRIASSVLVLIVLGVSLPSAAAAQSGAKALFHGPPGSTANPRGPVGIFFWFENDQGARFTEARDAGVGARVRLHVQANTGGFLTVWMIDRTGKGVQLTPMEGKWAGHALAARRDYVVPVQIALPAKEDATRLLILFARAQMEQVGTAADAWEKIRRLSAAMGRDGAPAIVREADTSTPEQAGVYVVHREGAQPGVAIEIGR